MVDNYNRQAKSKCIYENDNRTTVLVKTTRTQVGEKATEDPAIGAVQLRYNKEVNKGLKQILAYCNDYEKATTEGEIEHTKENFES